MSVFFNYFANSLWQVPLLGGCCWCALRLARASAGVRYGAWITTLLLCVVLPWRGAAPAREATVTVSTGLAVVASKTTQAMPPLPFYAVRITARLRDFLAEGYLALTAMLLLRLMLSYAAQRRLGRRAGLLSEGQAARVADLGADAERVGVLPDGHSIPLVAGVWRPLVLVPEALLASDEETLRAVLAHEFAHLARRDTLVDLALRLVALPVAYHPATGLIEREIRHARELLCDAVAARSLQSAAAYAQALLRLARELVHTGGQVSGSTVGLFARTSKPLLEERIMKLVAPPVPARVVSRALRLAAGTTMFGAAVVCSSIVHLTPSVLAAQEPVLAAPAATTQPAPVVAPPQSSPKRHIAADPAHERDLLQAQTELAAARKQLDRPEFKQQMLAAQAQIKQATQQLAAATRHMEEVRRQMDSVEFRQQMEQVRTVTAKAQADVPQLIAEARAQAMLGLAAPRAMQDADAPQKVGAGMMEGAVAHRVTPIYPPMAKAAGVSGTVVVKAVIAKDGTIQNLQVLSGPEMLKSATLDAVRQWVYTPYLLNGQPTMVETTISVTFTLPE